MEAPAAPPEDDAYVTTPDRNVWERTAPAWHAVFVLFTVGTGVLAVAGGRGPGPVLLTVTLLTVTLLAVILLAHALLAARAMEAPLPSRAGVAYLLVTVPATLAVFALDRVGATMLFVLFPMLWRLLPTPAAVTTTVLVVAAVGGLSAAAQPGPPSPAMIALFGSAAVCAVLLGLWITAICDQSERRAAVLDELERTRSELVAAHREAGALAERERFARDVHDTLAQGFTSLMLLVRAASEQLERDPDAARRHLDLAESTARDNLADARALVGAASPAGPAGDPLTTALERLVSGAREALGVPVRLDTADWRAGGGPAPVEPVVAVLRLAQEALANVRRHADAGTVDVLLSRWDGGIRLEVHDDGRGFDPEAPRPDRYGVDGMHHRVAELGGTLGLDSAPGAGCRLVAWVPEHPVGCGPAPGRATGPVPAGEAG